MGAVNELIDRDVVTQLEDSLRAASPRLPLASLARAKGELAGTTLRQRVDTVRDALLIDLPVDFLDAERVVADALDDPAFTGWMIWPVSEFMATRALQSGSTPDFDSAMDMLTRLTPELTSEFAVRDLLAARPERSVAIMQTWTEHANEHVRRLATEGSRAYLPWAKRVPWLLSHPRATRSILDASYGDSAEYVRRSVANHLNDLSRIDPSVATDIASGWARRPLPTTPWVVRHGLRTLVKRADHDALELVGFSGRNLHVQAPHVEKPLLSWEGTLAFSAVVSNHGDREATVAIDYSIGFVRANGSTKPKTFKIGSRRIAAGASIAVTKSHSLRSITTRNHYPGRHFVTVHANGVVSDPTQFTIEAPDA